MGVVQAPVVVPNGHEGAGAISQTIVLAVAHNGPEPLIPASATDQEQRRCIVTADPAVIEARNPYLGPPP